MGGVPMKRFWAMLVLFYGITFFLGAMVGRWLFGRNDAIALIYGMAPKNLSSALAIAMNAFGAQRSDIALVIALAYVFQLQTSAWCNKLVDRCFGQLERHDMRVLVDYGAGSRGGTVDTGGHPPGASHVCN